MINIYNGFIDSTALDVISTQSIPSVSTISPQPLSVLSDITIHPPHSSTTLPSEDQALQALRRALGKPNAIWSSKGQREAVISCLKWAKDLIVILPTGSGKSAIIATVASLEKNKITAVLCPLKSLMTDWARRLTAMNIAFEIFSRHKPTITGQAPIVLVSLDATVRSYWRRAVTELRSDFVLNRMVVDEAHLLLTEATYRDVMHHVKELREHRFQMVLLSATIPPTSIASLRSQANLAKGLLTHVIRASSNRPELSFQTPIPYPSFAAVCCLFSLIYSVLLTP